VAWVRVGLANQAEAQTRPDELGQHAPRGLLVAHLVVGPDLDGDGAVDEEPVTSVQ
jgi:hypothetical protein